MLLERGGINKMRLECSAADTNFTGGEGAFFAFSLETHVRIRSHLLGLSHVQTGLRTA